MWLQPHYNLVERDGYERDYAPIVAVARARRRALLRARERLPDRQVPPGRQRRRLARAPRQASSYLDARGEAVLAALDEVAAAHGVEVAAVAVAWLLTKPGVTSPIASARTPEQLAAVLPAVDLQLTADQITRLDEASA